MKIHHLLKWTFHITTFPVVLSHEVWLEATSLSQPLLWPTELTMDGSESQTAMEMMRYSMVMMMEITMPSIGLMISSYGQMRGECIL